LVESKFGYHTHPKTAYERNNVKIAWPSVDDYLSFLETIEKYHTLFHCVITLEGIYFISFRYWVPITSHLEQLVKQYYDIPYDDTPLSQYLNTINNMENGIFDIQFMSWNNIRPIAFSFPLQKGLCSL